MLSYGELGCQLPIFTTSEERQAAIEDSLCELDAAVNK